MKVYEVMTCEVITVRSETSIRDAPELMGTYGVSGLPVVDGRGAVEAGDARAVSHLWSIAESEAEKSALETMARAIKGGAESRATWSSAPRVRTCAGSQRAQDSDGGPGRGSRKWGSAVPGVEPLPTGEFEQAWAAGPADNIDEPGCSHCSKPIHPGTGPETARGPRISRPVAHVADGADGQEAGVGLKGVQEPPGEGRRELRAGRSVSRSLISLRADPPV